MLVSINLPISLFIFLNKKGEERKVSHQKLTPDLDLCNSGVHIFAGLYVSSKMFTPIGLIIAPRGKWSTCSEWECNAQRLPT